MTQSMRAPLLFLGVAALFILEGSTDFLFFTGSWDSAFAVLNMALISAVLALGVNLQWGFAGLFNVGVVGFVALGGVATVLVSMPPVEGAWEAGGARVLMAICAGIASVVAAVLVWTRLDGKVSNRLRTLLLIAVLIVGYVVFDTLFSPAAKAIESVNPALEGYLGGLGLPVLLAWPVGGLMAAVAAWVIGKTALGLRSDYLAIATLGIAEIIIAVIKNEDWLARGVKNVYGIPRPVPYEIDLQNDPGFVERAASWGMEATDASTLFVKFGYAVHFAAVLVVVLILAQLALRSPWGRMMRAIRDNEDAAEAMGKDVTKRRLQVFVLGSALCGMGGAMFTTMTGILSPTVYQPLDFTFLIWVMVIVGGSGNNYGAVLGGLLITFLWIQAQPMGLAIMETITAGMADGSALKAHLIDSVAHMRLLTMGLVLLLVLRFSPKGLLPER